MHLSHSLQALPLLHPFHLNSLTVVQANPSSSGFQLTPTSFGALAGSGLHNREGSFSCVLSSSSVVGPRTFPDVQVCGRYLHQKRATGGTASRTRGLHSTVGRILQINPSGSTLQTSPAIFYFHNGKEPFSRLAFYASAHGWGRPIIQIRNDHLYCKGSRWETGSSRAAAARSRTASCRISSHSSFHCLAESIHGISHTKAVPKMLRIAMVGRNPTAVALPVTDDHTVCGRIQIILLAQHGEQFHRRLIGTFCHSPCRGQVGTGKV